MGHAPSVNEPREQVRWRFSSGVSIYFGFLQVIAMGVAGAAIAFKTGLFLLPCAAVWAGSLWYFGGVLERRVEI
jgi:hypothetical protein